MKTRIVLTMLVLLCVAGCGEPLTQGFVAGVATEKALADTVQKDFVRAVNALNAKTQELDIKREAIRDIDMESFIKPETVEAFRSLEGRENDPLTWIALASVLGNIFWGGKAYGERKKKEKS